MGAWQTLWGSVRRSRSAGLVCAGLVCAGLVRRCHVAKVVRAGHHHSDPLSSPTLSVLLSFLSTNHSASAFTQGLCAQVMRAQVIRAQVMRAQVMRAQVIRAQVYRERRKRCSCEKVMSCIMVWEKIITSTSNSGYQQAWVQGYYPPMCWRYVTVRTYTWMSHLRLFTSPPMIPPYYHHPIVTTLLSPPIIPHNHHPIIATP
jgi:hypothetical protein